MEILKSSVLICILAMIVAITNGQRQNKKVAVAAGGNKSVAGTGNTTLEALFGSTVCKGRYLLTQKIQSESERCSGAAAASMEAVVGGSNNKTKNKLPKNSKKNAMKCTTTCLWKLWGLTDNNKIGSKMNPFITETFPKDVKVEIIKGLETCTSDDAKKDNKPSDKKQTDACTEHLHVTRCFKKVIKQACSDAKAIKGASTAKPRTG